MRLSITLPDVGRLIRIRTADDQLTDGEVVSMAAGSFVAEANVPARGFADPAAAIAAVTAAQ
jgi:hypothetical protein